MSVQDFIDELGLDLVVEQVGENPDLPHELAVQAVHYRLELMRYGPYRSEHLVFSEEAEAALMHLRPDPLTVLVFMAMCINDYRAYPEPSAWARAKRLPDVPGIHEQWHTFGRDEAKLTRIFGDDFERFLALDPRRAG